MNTRKSLFLTAVRIIAPDDSFVYELAKCVPEEVLPDPPGVAALEFVTALCGMCEETPNILAELSAGKSSTAEVAMVERGCRRRSVPIVTAPVRHRCGSGHAAVSDEYPVGSSSAEN